jgi:hypothetical protein
VGVPPSGVPFGGVPFMLNVVLPAAKTPVGSRRTWKPPRATLVATGTRAARPLIAVASPTSTSDVAVLVASTENEPAHGYGVVAASVSTSVTSCGAGTSCAWIRRPALVTGRSCAPPRIAAPVRSRVPST